MKNKWGMYFPSHLFKYKYDPGHIHLFDLLKSKCLHLTNPDSLNDIYEMRFVIQRELLHSYFTRNTENLSSQIKNALVSLIGLAPFRNEFSEKLSNTFRNNTAMYCLTSDSNSELMWAHYGNAHRGYLLHFDFQHAQSEITDFIYRVKYVPETPKINSIDDAIVAGYTKNQRWSYEKEFRLLFFTSKINMPEKVPINPNCLIAITFGYKVPDHSIAEVQDILFKEGFSHVVIYKQRYNIEGTYSELF